MTKKIDETWDKSKPWGCYLPVMLSHATADFRDLAGAPDGREVAFGGRAGSQA